MKQMIIRIDEVTRDKMMQLARQEGKSSNEVVRELIAQYIKNRDISGYIDDLWKRAGNNLKKRGIQKAKLLKIIQEVRARK
jgi:predicted DNA-binding protein